MEDQQQKPVAMVVVKDDLTNDEFYWKDAGLLLDLPPGEYDLYFAASPSSSVLERAREALAQQEELRWVVNGFLEWHEGNPCPDGLIERARAAVPVTPSDEQPCQVCGGSERSRAGYLLCECPAASLRPADAIDAARSALAEIDRALGGGNG